MTMNISRRMPLRRVLAAIAVAAALPLAACNPLDQADQSAEALPPLPATLPLAPGEVRPPMFAPAAEQLPFVEPIDAVRVANPDDYYAYADDAWGFADALGYAPPDYGFGYDEVEPWAWQGYDDSLMFVEPLEDGYRTYYYRAGHDEPYFIRDPYYGYGYDDGRLAVVYAGDGGIIPYQYYGPRLDYASRYYARGRQLYGAAHRRRPVIAREWEARRVPLLAAQSRWGRARERQQPWQAYHARNAVREASYWREERTRRNAEAVRFAAWREQDFTTPPPPRAIPANWRRADWARDERRFSPPSRGFDGDAADRRRAAADERFRLAALNRQAVQERGADRRDDQRRLREDDARRAAELASLQRDRPQAQERLERRAFAQQQAQAGRERPQAPVRQEQRAAERSAQVQQRQAQAEQRTVEAEQRRARNEQARNEQARNSQVEQQQRSRQQAEARRNQARQNEARQAAQQREQAQARGREQAEQRRQAQARQRDEAQARIRAQAEQRRSERAASEQSRQARGQAEQRQAQQRQTEQRQAEQRQQAEQRRQVQRQQAEERTAEQTQQREQAQQRRQAQLQERAQARAARTERPQREAKAGAPAERLAQAGGRERRERRQD